MDISSIDALNVLKALSVFTVSYNSQVVSGIKGAERLRDAYTKPSTGISVTHALINFGVSKGETSEKNKNEEKDEWIGNYGTSNALTSLNGVRVKLNYVGNARTGEYE